MSVGRIPRSGSLAVLDQPLLLSYCTSSYRYFLCIVARSPTGTHINDSVVFRCSPVLIAGFPQRNIVRKGGFHQISGTMYVGLCPKILTSLLYVGAVTGKIELSPPNGMQIYSKLEQPNEATALT